MIYKRDICVMWLSLQGVSDASQMNNLSAHTAEQGVYALDQFIRAVYHSSIDKDIGACDFESLSEFVCGREDPWRSTPWYPKLNAPIRAGNQVMIVLI